MGVHVAGLGKLHFEALTKSYSSVRDDRDVVVLDGIDLDVGRGEFLVVVGPSGSGKSTLLDLAAGLSLPTTGRVLLDGVEIRAPGPQRSVVFQNYALLPWKTAIENIAFALKAAGRPKAGREQAARQFLDLVGLGHAAHYYPHQLSGGMKQRVAIARALSVGPEVLLMDEPFAALDAQSRETLQGELRRVWRRAGTTMVFITHDIDEALLLGQRVVVLGGRPGRVVDEVRLPFSPDDDIDEIRAHPDYASLRHSIRSALSGGSNLS